MKRPPLRVALLVDAPTIPAWVARIVRDIQGSGVATVALVIVVDGPPPPRGAFLYELYTKLDARKFGPPTDPFAPTDLAGLAPDVPQRRMTARATPAGDELADADVEALRAARLDVALCTRARAVGGAALGIARHGVWMYRDGDDRVVRGAPPGFWEVMDGHLVTGATLRVLTDDPGGRVIDRSWSTTHPVSVRVSRHNYVWQASAFVIRKLRDLHRNGPDALTDLAPVAASAYGGRAYAAPGNRTMARLIARMAGRYLARQLRERIEYRQWALAYRFGAPAADKGFGVLSGVAPSPEECGKEPMPDLMLSEFRMLLPPPDRVWADPFPVQHEGRHHVLFEEMPYASAKGHIAVASLDPDGTMSTPEVVLERPYHLSYPFVFEWQGAHYMIPESAANATVDLYRATRFPYEWTFERTLLERSVVDTTLAEIGGRWWMFANAPAVPEAPYASMYWDELSLYVAESPLGPWTPHPRNPVVSDVRCARPAGRLFQRDGVWYRPAQCSAGLYGAALAIQRIVRIDPERYEEAPVTTLTPSWRPGLSGLHTVNATRGLTVIDVAVRRRRHPFARRRRGPRQ